MFEQTFVSVKTKQGFTSLLGLGIQALLVGGAMLLPLIYTETISRASMRSILMAPAPPPPPPPAVKNKTPVKIFRDPCGGLCAPNKVPVTPPLIVDDGPVMRDTRVVGEVPGAPTGNGTIGSFIPTAAPPSPPTVHEPPKAEVPKQIRVGGVVQAANLIRKVTPVYPPMAKTARIQGTVRFTAIIGKDGTIQNLQLVSSSSPLLVNAASEAVKQWVYKPTRLNGEPVEVITNIDVTFTLTQ